MPPPVELAANRSWNLRRRSPSITPETPPSVRQAFEADRAAAAAARAALFVPCLLYTSDAADDM
eukprot:11151323-Alexandrium_andersonii.AAC.1